MYHNTFPTINWVTVSNGVLPPNAVAAGVVPNGEVLYVGRGEHEDDMIPGYIVHSEKRLHICYAGGEHYFQDGDYEALTLDQGSYEWGVYFEGDFPENGVVANDFEDGDEDLFVGRTVTDSNISTAATRDKVPINLPYGRVATT